jgi:tetratricopeptide (TPR) repeat protein
LHNFDMGIQWRQLLLLVLSLANVHAIQPPDSSRACEPTPTKAAMRFFAAKDYNAALRCLQLAVTQTRNVQTLINLATAHLQLNQGEQALITATEAIQLQPGHVPAHAAAAHAAYLLGRHAVSLQHARVVLQLEPRHLQCLLYAAAAEGSLHNAVASVALYEEALRLDPTSTSALINIAVELGKLGRFPDARRHLDQALARDPSAVQVEV